MPRARSRRSTSRTQNGSLSKLPLVGAVLVIFAAVWLVATLISRSLDRQALAGKWTRSDGLDLVFYLLDKPKLVVSYPHVAWGSSARNLQVVGAPDGAGVSVEGSIEFRQAPCLGAGQTATLNTFNVEAEGEQDSMEAEFADVKLTPGHGRGMALEATGGKMTVHQRLKGAIERPEDAVLSASGPVQGALHLELKRRGQQLSVTGDIAGDFAR